MPSFSYLLLSRRAQMRRNPTMVNITVLQSERKWDFCCVTHCNLLIRRAKRLVNSYRAYPAYTELTEH